MLYQAIHETRYTYDEPVAQCLSEARLTPRSTPNQRVRESRLQIVPEPAVMDSRKDFFGNEVTAFSVFRTHDHFSVTASSVVDVQPRWFDNTPGITWEASQRHLASHPDAASLEALQFAFESPFVPLTPELADYARSSFPPGRDLASAARELSHRVNKEFVYKPKSTSIDTPLAEVLRTRRGVCQDFAHVLIGSLRSLRLSARYVSGYLRSGEDVVGAEASHAWVSVFVPGYGWLDLDPTNDLLPSDQHITLAWGRDFGDVTPIKGISLGGGGQKIDVEVHVTPVEGAAQ